MLLKNNVVYINPQYICTGVIVMEPYSGNLRALDYVVRKMLHDDYESLYTLSDIWFERKC